MIQLDRHIEILLLSNDCVIIPGFGGFMAHYVEARNDVRDNAILPPMRTVGFNPKLTLNDSLLAQSYVEVYDISYPDAVARIEDEVRELRQHIENDGEYTLNDVGVLRLNGDGQYEFEPCSAGILTPSLYGLSYYSMKSVAQLEAELAPVVQPLAGQGAQLPPDQRTAAMQQSVETAQEKEGSRWRPASMVALWRGVAAACVAAVAFMLIPAPLANNGQVVKGSIDTYLLDRVMPHDVTTGEEHVTKLIRASRPAIAAQQKGEAVAEPEPRSGYTLVFASRVSRRNAVRYAAELRRRGLSEAEALLKPKGAKVVCGRYATEPEARKALRTFTSKPEFADAWIMKY